MDGRGSLRTFCISDFLQVIPPNVSQGNICAFTPGAHEGPLHIMPISNENGTKLRCCCFPFTLKCFRKRHKMKRCRKLCNFDSDFEAGDHFLFLALNLELNRSIFKHSQ